MRLPNQSPAVRRNSVPGAMGTGVTASLRWCGACSELKWPNGTGTGVCRQDCCTSVQRWVDGHIRWVTTCQFESCSCPITGLGGWLRWLTF
jgi:hypothetical protein